MRFANERIWMISWDIGHVKTLQWTSASIVAGRGERVDHVTSSDLNVDLVRYACVMSINVLHNDARDIKLMAITVLVPP